MQHSRWLSFYRSLRKESPKSGKDDTLAILDRLVEGAGGSPEELARDVQTLARIVRDRLASPRERENA